MQTVTVAGGVGAALVGGVFFAFSAFVMPALRTPSTKTTSRAVRGTVCLPHRVKETGFR